MQDAKRRAIIFAVVSLLLAVVAGLLFLQKVNAVDKKLGEKTTVYVAKKNIQPREPLSASSFEAKEVPTQYVDKSAVTDLKKIEQLGDISQLVTIVPLAEGELLTTNVLKRKMDLTTGENRLVFLGRSDKVFYDQQVDYFDRVDIVVSRDGKNGPETVILFKDVLVVAVAMDDNKKFNGAGVELPLDQATELIHAQNFAKSIRVLKAPQERSSISSKREESTNLAGKSNNTTTPSSKTNKSKGQQSSTNQPKSTGPNKDDNN